LSKEINKFYGGANKAFGNDSLMTELLSRLNVINMLNTKYFIIPGGENGRSAMPFENKMANGNAWFVKKVKTVADADNEITELYKINTKEESVMQEKFAKELSVKQNYSGEGKITLDAYEPNHLTYSSESSEDQLAVFSEIFYPFGWNAYIDGNIKPHACTNYVLRAMTVPAGKHKIEFKFEPKTYQNANSIALAGSAILFLAIGLGVFLEQKNKKTVN
jgi:uncharacterized membrane protein YfhO